MLWKIWKAPRLSHDLNLSLYYATVESVLPQRLKMLVSYSGSTAIATQSVSTKDIQDPLCWLYIKQVTVWIFPTCQPDNQTSSLSSSCPVNVVCWHALHSLTKTDVSKDCIDYNVFFHMLFYGKKIFLMPTETAKIHIVIVIIMSRPCCMLACIAFFNKNWCVQALYWLQWLLWHVFMTRRPSDLPTETAKIHRLLFLSNRSIYYCTFFL